MRLGGPLAAEYDSPESWIRDLKDNGYGAAYAPLHPDADDVTVAAYAGAAKDADIIIAEVGGWSNPMDPNPVRAKEAIAHSQACLELAERLGARCCVNIAGSLRADKWDGPHPDSFSADTFARVVDVTRVIIDAVKPRRTFYALEPMPWMLPSSVDEYLRLIEAIDRPAMGAHLDPVNLINSPAIAYNTSAFLKDAFQRLGPYIKSCHAKDIRLSDELTVHLSESRPGLGTLDYRTFIKEVEKLGADSAMMLEHLPKEEYAPAAAHIRGVAGEIGVAIR